MAFQTGVNVQPAPAVAGDFADHNPRWNVEAGPGGLIAGPNGLTVGRAAWLSYSTTDPNGAPAVANNFGQGPIGGFVTRVQQAMITTYLAEGSMVVPAGFGVTLINGGAIWVKNDGAAEALVGHKVYANYATGQLRFAATGSPAAGGSATGSIAASTFAVTGSITNDVLTVTAVSSGTIVNGATISGTGVASGTQVLAQLSGAAGGIGTYRVSIPEQTVASTAVSGTYGTFTAASGLTGAFTLGGLISGTGTVAGTHITQFLTGAGGLGTYVVDNNTVVASTAISETGDVETKFFATSAGAPGELVKITSHLLG